VLPAGGSLALTTEITSSQIQETVTSGVYHPSAKTYSVAGTSTSDTSDNICGVPGSPFTISGIIGPEVPITMDDKYTFQGTGDIKEKPYGTLILLLSFFVCTTC
jgi:hypothetical protein